MTDRIGSQTPSQSIVLSYDQSKGDEAVGLYEESKRTAYDWQKLLIENIMAQNEDGLWIHQRYGYEVPRQNGKGEILAIREVWGLVNGEKILHTAHKTSTSSSAFQRLLKILTDAGYVELGRKRKDQIIPPKSFKATKQYGLEQIFMTNGGYITFRTRTETGGLGESFDLLIIDEAQEYTGSQESALKYTIAASPNPQTIFCGTPPTLVSKGDVFKDLRSRVLSGNSEETGWSEWSIYEKPSDVMDVDLWYLTNPSLGLRLRERTIRTEKSADVLDFLIQRLGYWHSYELKSEISEAEWMSLKCDKLPEFKGKLFLGIKFGSNGENVTMSVAVKCASGKTFLETIDCQSQSKGFDWMIRFIKEAKVSAIAIDGQGKSGLLADMIRENLPKSSKINIVVPTASEAVTAYSGFRQAIDDETIVHSGQPSVTQAVSNCKKRMIGHNGAFGFQTIREGIDVSIVESLAFAHWICSITKERRKQRIGY